VFLAGGARGASLGSADPTSRGLLDEHVFAAEKPTVRRVGHHRCGGERVTCDQTPPGGLAGAGRWRRGTRRRLSCGRGRAVIAAEACGGARGLNGAPAARVCVSQVWCVLPPFHHLGRPPAASLRVPPPRPPLREPRASSSSPPSTSPSASPLSGAVGDRPPPCRWWRPVGGHAELPSGLFFW